MNWLSEELSGWPIGSGYYSTSVGTDEAKDMARTIEEALLADDVIERVADLLYQDEFEEPMSTHDDWCTREDCTAVEGFRSTARTALEAALGIEGGE